MEKFYLGSALQAALHEKKRGSKTQKKIGCFIVKKFLISFQLSQGASKLGRVVDRCSDFFRGISYP